MKKITKILALTLALVVMGAFLAACGGGSSSAAAGGTSTPAASTPAAGGGDGDKYDVACIFRVQDMYAAWLRVAFENAMAANYPSMNFTLLDYKDDQNVWQELMDNVIVQSFDFVVSQNMRTDVTPYIQAVKDAGIPFIGINSMWDYLEGLCPVVVCDEYMLGKVIGDAGAKNLPENAKVLILDGPAGLPLSEDRHRGIVEGLAETRDDIEILDSQVAEFRKEDAMGVTDDWLQVYTQVDGVLAASDSMVLGAIESFRTNGRDITETQFYGIDGLVDACLSIQKGEMTGSALQDANLFAKYSLDMIQEHIDGNVDLLVDTEVIEFTPVLLDKSNVDEQVALYEELGFIK